MIYHLELSEQMMHAIINALGNHAYREAAPVLAEIQKQVRIQSPPLPPSMNGGQPSEEKPNA